jgi:hypothetical protein
MPSAKLHQRSARALPPGPRGYPFIGVLPQALSRPLETLTSAARLYGGVVRTHELKQEIFTSRRVRHRCRADVPISQGKSSAPSPPALQLSHIGEQIGDDFRRLLRCSSVLARTVAARARP